MPRQRGTRMTTDPKPTGKARCLGCGTKYPLGNYCGYCRRIIQEYRERAETILRDPVPSGPRVFKCHLPRRGRVRAAA
jgi:hypothetical protein